MSKPFFWKARKGWYIKDESGNSRKNIFLHEDEKPAFTIWLKMCELAEFATPDATIEALCEAWLSEFKNQLSDDKYKDAVRCLKSFCVFVSPSTKARTLAHSQMIDWLASQTEWSDSRKSDAAFKVRRVTRWAYDQTYIPQNPFAGIKIQKGKSRQRTLTYAEHKASIEDLGMSVRSRTFRPLLIALWHTGARPTQIREVTVDNVKGEVWVFQEHKTEAKTERPLVVTLSPCMRTLTKILVARRDKHLFLNWDGEPFTKNAIVRRMAGLRKRLGLTDVVAYSYRHSYATDALESGVGINEVAAMLGHVNSAMVAKVYGHLDQRHLHLQKEQAKLGATRSKSHAKKSN